MEKPSLPGPQDPLGRMKVCFEAEFRVSMDVHSLQVVAALSDAS